MKKKNILIVGENSYIGNSLESWLSNSAHEYHVAKVKTRNNEWNNIFFGIYDVVIHVAGIAHVSRNPELETLYYKVNRDMAIDVANKAKIEGVRQFIFMSSIIIYGEDSTIGESKVINSKSEFLPIDFYGRSKLEADLAIQKLKSDEFKTVIVRAPLVYGPNCKGNFPKLLKLARYTPLFVNIYNERSMIYIDNLCEFLKLTMDTQSEGVFYPQNKEYVSTKAVIEVAAKLQNKKILFTNIFNKLLGILSSRISLVNKVFGNKVYDRNLSRECNWDYYVVDFEKSVEMTLKGGEG